MTNTDLRSGRPIISAFEDLTSRERAGRRLEHAAERFAPVSQLTRAADEGTGVTEGAEALIRRLLFGSIAKPVDVEGNRARAIDRAVTRGQHDASEEATAARRADVRRYVDQLVARGVVASEQLLGEQWGTLDRSHRGLMVAALKEAARRDRRFSGLYARWHAVNRGVSDREAPFVQRELQQKGFVTPVTPVR